MNDETASPKKPGSTRGWRRSALRIAIAGLVVYALLLAAIWSGQERLLFQPTPLPAQHRFDLGADVHETWIAVPGARLNALHLRLPKPHGVVFFLHGNAGNLQSWFVNIDYYRRIGWDLFMIDYRGYGKSGGSIDSQQQLLDDVRAAWAAVAPRYAELGRVVYGRSLGTGPAAMLAAEVGPDLTVLVSPYSSIAELASEHYPWVPGALLRYPLDTGAAVAKLTTPLLLVHGSDDALIPPAHSSELARRSPQARLLIVDGAGHNDIQRFAAYLDGLSSALKTVEAVDAGRGSAARAGRR